MYIFHNFIPSLENSVDPDQLASSEARADHDPHCFPSTQSIHINNEKNQPLD